MPAKLNGVSNQMTASLIVASQVRSSACLRMNWIGCFEKMTTEWRTILDFRRHDNGN